MKKIFTSLIVLLCGFAVKANPVFETDFSDDLTQAGWTIVDANGDGKTWENKVLTDGNTVANVTYNSMLDTDDWLISPAITIDETSVYLLSMLDAGSSYVESMGIYWGTEPTVEAMDNLIVDLPSMSHNDLKPEMALFQLDGDQTIYIGFHARSAADAFHIYIDDLSLAPASGVDVSAQALIAPVTGNDLGQETVTMELKNTGFETVESIPVGFSNGDGQEVKETVPATLAPGQSMEYTFASKIDLSSPRTDYPVKVWTALEADKVQANDTVLTIVRHEAPATLPYFMGFESTDRPQSILNVDANNDGAIWGLMIDLFDKYSRSGMFSYCSIPEEGTVGDDWFILEPMFLDAGYYQLEFYASALGYDDCPIDVYLFNEQDAASESKLLSANVVPAASGYVRFATVIKIDENCVRSIGFKTSAPVGGTPIFVDDISVSAMEDPQEVDLSFAKMVSPASDYMRGQSEDIILDVKNAGVEEAKDVVVQVKLDGQSVGSVTMDIPAISEAQAVFAGKLAGLAEGEHTVQVTMEQSKDASADDNTMEKSFLQLGDAQLLYDFEDGQQLSEEFTLMNNDGIPVSDQLAGYFPNNEAFRVLGFEEPDPVFGYYCLLGASYLSQPVQTDRWVVFPAAEVPDNGVLVYDAGSMDVTYPEVYQVLVSEEDTPQDFTQLLEVNGEASTVDPATHAIDLADYAGKSVHVAFHLTSTDCFMLLLDNIGLYGDPVSTALVNVDERKAVSVKIVDNQLEVAADNMNRVCIYDMQGRQVKTTTEQVTSVADWDAGGY